MRVERLKEEEDDEEKQVEAEEERRCSCCLLTLPLGEWASTFDLQKAVCSHGLFMMAPNLWDPSTKTLERPLRLSDATTSLLVRISHPPDSLASLHVRVFGADSLSPHDQQALLTQVARMLRLSDNDERNVREFHKIHPTAKDRGFGRVFRSPTLFEDMVKCILLCNCRWPRTLTMARALCELQLDLKCDSGCPVDQAAGPDFRCSKAGAEDFLPKTPIGRESKRKHGVQKICTNLASKFAKIETEMEEDVYLRTSCDQSTYCLQQEDLNSSIVSSLEGSHEECKSSKLLNANNKVNACPILDIQFSEGRPSNSYYKIGNFPSPIEIAGLDEGFLAKRCNLGYRANWILKLARSIVEGRLQLRQLEELCNGASTSHYDNLSEKLKEINGFGPFTCANVLMCMGFYKTIPTDTETIRHLKQVHAIKSTIRTVRRDVEKIYGQYAPFQFLAYWSELWNFYDERFGKLSEMPHSNYQLITASNMRTKRSYKSTKIS